MKKTEANVLNEGREAAGGSHLSYLRSHLPYPISYPISHFQLPHIIKGLFAIALLLFPLSAGAVQLGGAGTGHPEKISGTLEVTGNVKIGTAGASVEAATGKYYGDGSALTGISSGQWTTSGNNIYNTNSGNVGIGTTEPTAKLQIIGEDAGSVQMNVINKANTSQYKYFGFNVMGPTAYGIPDWPNAVVLESATDGGLVFSAHSGPTLFKTGTSRLNRMAITNAGKVGIGTTAPAATFEVGSNHTLVADAGTGRVGIGTTAPQSHLNIYGSDTGGVSLRIDNTAASGTYKYFSVSQLGSVAAGITGWPNAALLEGAADGGVVISAFAGPFKLQTGAARAIRLTVNTDGNVGIGTTSPSRTLEVFGIVRATSFEGSGAALTGIVASDSTKLPLAGGTMSGTITSTAGSTITATGDAYLATGDGGKVGIGMTNPAEKLNVQGATAGSGSGTTKIKINQPASTVSGITELVSGVSGGRNPYFAINVREDASPYQIRERMRIDPAGNVGIATTAPGATLEVNGNIKVSGTQNSSFTGNVGIGLTNPSQTLHIYTPSGTNKRGLQVISEQAGYTAYLAAGKDFGAGVVTVDNNDPNKSIFFVLDGVTIDSNKNSVGGTYRFAVKQGGNVAIGTSEALAKLHVKDGNISIEGTGQYYGDGSALTGITATDSSKLPLAGGKLTGVLTTETTVHLATLGGNVGIGTTAPTSTLSVIAPAISGAESIMNFGVADAADSYFKLSNGTSLGTVFLPTISAKNATDNRWGLQFSSLVADAAAGSALTPAQLIRSANRSSQALTTVPVVSFVNADKALLTTWYDGLTRIGGTDIIDGGAVNGATRPGAQLEVDTYNASTKGLIVKGYAAQTANLQEWQDAGGNALAVVDGSGKVGIGTTAPSNLLSLKPATNVAQLRLEQNNATDAWTLLADSSDGKLAFSRVGTGGVANALNIAMTTGNIGVGTASPKDKLHVAGNLQTSRGAYIGSAANSGAIQLGVSGGAQIGFIQSGSDDILQFITHHNAVSHAVRMTIDRDGNVGIGTTAPIAKLGVNGNISIEGTGKYYGDGSALTGITATDSSKLPLAGGTMSGTITSTAGTTITATGDAYLATGATGKVGIGTTEVLTSYKVHVLTSAANVAQLESTASWANLALKGGQSGDVAWALMSGYPNAGDFTIRQAGVGNYVNIKKDTGNVGIGTTESVSKLTVAGTVELTAGGVKFPDGTIQTTKAAAGGWSTGSGIIYATTTSDKVGIGTTNPTNNLEIKGAGTSLVRIQHGTSANYGHLTFANETGTQQAFIGTIGSGFGDATRNGHFEIGSSAGNNIYFRPGDSGNPVTFTTAGNVGIGTTEPSTKLEIAGTVRATSFEGSGAALTGVIASSGSATDSTKVLKSGDTMSGNLTVETDIRLSGAASAISGPNFKITPEGGYAIRLKNFTGATSVKGTLAAISNEVSGEMGFLATPAESDRPIGAVYDSGVANGEYCWVVVAGIADVLLKNSTATAAGYFMMTSDAAGRALPKADGPQNVAEHNREIGHCLETKSAGTNVLAKIVMHFN